MVMHRGDSSRIPTGRFSWLHTLEETDVVSTTVSPWRGACAVSTITEKGLIREWRY
jgi:hypothetical protein